MTAQTPPYALQTVAGGHGAELFRRANFFGASSVGGIKNTTDLAATQTGTPDMHTNIATGEILIPGTSTTTQGMYYGLNDASVALTHSASSPSNPRIDVDIAQVQDAAYAGAVNNWQLAVVTGTPAASPAVPSIPASSLPIDNVAIAANATTIVNGNITDKRQLAQASNAIRLPYLSGHLSASSVALGVNTNTTILTTGSLAVGTWLVSALVTFYLTDGAGAGAALLNTALGTATATLDGAYCSPFSPTAATSPGPAVVSFTAVVTVAGTLLFKGISSGASGGSAVQAGTWANGGYTNATGWTALKVA